MPTIINFFSTSTNFINGGLYFLLGSLIAAFVSHLLAKDKDRQIHKIITFHEAATKFRHSFDDILWNIEKESLCVHELLREFFVEHKVAMCHFKYYIAGKDRVRFENSWGKYQEFYNNNYEQGSVLAQFNSSSALGQAESRLELKKHIESLIKFAV